MPTRAELYEEASDLEIEGRSDMNKDELEAAVNEARGTSGPNDPTEVVSQEADYIEREFTLLKSEYFGEEDHDRYIWATEQQAFHRGLKLTSDVEFAGAEEHSDGVSVTLSFRASTETREHSTERRTI